MTHPASASWHTLSAAEAAAALVVDPAAGLAADDVERRLARHGPNVIREERRRGPLRVFFGQFTDFMIVVLIAAAVVSGVVGDLQDTLAIIAILVLNAGIGFAQEYRAERAIAALKHMAAASASVMRDGARRTISANELVPGDVVQLEAGNIVPADMRLTEAAQLKVGEAALTGESVPVSKQVDALAEDRSPLGDRRNMAFKGTLVTYGRGLGIVVATGMATELGRIAETLGHAGATRTPLQIRLAQFGRRLAIAALGLCLLVFIFGLARGEPALLMLLTALSLGVAAIPEALPAVVTILLALGARKMVAHNALVRRLPAVETLGSVTHICTDKTGTLTRNEMRVESMLVDGRVGTPPKDATAGDSPSALFAAMALCNDAQRAADGQWTGDPTEVALAVAAAESGHDRSALDKDMPRVAELPFEPKRKRMTTLHRHGNAIVAYTKGAPESVLPRCAAMLSGDDTAPLQHQEMLAAAEQMAADGLRVLAIAMRHWPDPPHTIEADVIETDLILLGLVGLLDAPRPEAVAAVKECRSAGITPIMITGDHPATARAIARRTGIADGEATVLTGAELAALSDEALADRIEAISVYARVDPEQKIRIVHGLQSRGHFVAMTGDGVNDAPALRQAEIGVAMGRAGTDVAREAASLVLLDDNFATIVAAVREGRRIYDNIRKFIRYTMTTNAAEIWTVLLAPFLGLPLPLLPIHILWINLVTDGLPGLALAAEPAERDIMKRPPRPTRESMFARGMWQHMIWAGLAMTALAIFAQTYAIESGSPRWQTMVFTVLTLAQMGHALAIRSERLSLFQQGLFSNLPLLGAVALTFLLQMATVYLPFLNQVFHTAPLSAAELALCIVLAGVIFALVEIEKWLVRKGLFYAALPGRRCSGTKAITANSSE
jgi:Ca2+-transporting ATPase